MGDEPKTHFGQRAVERGITCCDTDALKYQLEQAIRDGNPKIEDCGWTKDDRKFYRFQVRSGIFYAVVSANTGVAVTCYSQREYRSARKRKKSAKRWQSAVDWRGPRTAFRR